MAREIKVLAARPGDQSSSFGAYIVKEQIELTKSPLASIYTLWHKDTHTHTPKSMQ